MVKCPFCQAEMRRSAIDVEMQSYDDNSIYVTYTNRYRCEKCGIIDHSNQKLRVELP